MPDSINLRLADSMVDQAVDLSRYSASMRKTVLGHLGQLEQDLAGKIQRYDIEGVARDAFKRVRAEALIRDVRATISGNYSGMTKSTISGLREMAAWQGPDAVARMNQVIGGNIVTATLTPGELKALADKTLIQGAPLKDWWGQQAKSTQNAFATEMRLGVAQGETNAQLVKRVIGGATGRKIEVVVNGQKKLIREFSGGIMQTSRRNAETLVRTATSSVSNRVLEETYKENSDVVKGSTWIATLDPRTCPVCMSYDGGAWDWEGKPLPQSKNKGPKPTRMPAHPGCRCVWGPITKSWEELIEEASGRKVKVLDSVPTASRASMDGMVPGKTDFNSWLKRKGEVFAEKTLGPGRFKLWKDGNISLPQLIDQTGRPLTLPQLEALKAPSLVPPKVPPKVIPVVSKEAFKATVDYAAAAQGTVDAISVNDIYTGSMEVTTKIEMLKLKLVETHNLGNYKRITKMLKKLGFGGPFPEFGGPVPKGTPVPKVLGKALTPKAQEAADLLKLQNKLVAKKVVNHVYLSGMDPALIPDIESTLTQFSKMTGKPIASIKMTHTPSGWLAAAHQDTGALVLNQKVWASGSKLKAVITQSYNSGWFVSKTPGDILLHELGHTIQYDMPRSMSYIRQWAGKYKQLVELVSKYGTTNEREVFAEAFTKVMQGKGKTNAWMKGFEEQLAKDFKARGWKLKVQKPTLPKVPGVPATKAGTIEIKATKGLAGASKITVKSSVNSIFAATDLPVAKKIEFLNIKLKETINAGNRKRITKMLEKLGSGGPTIKTVPPTSPPIPPPGPKVPTPKGVRSNFGFSYVSRDILNPPSSIRDTYMKMADEWYTQKKALFKTPLGARQVESLEGYTADAYEDISGQLVHGNKNPSPWLTENIRDIQSLLAKQKPTEFEMVVARADSIKAAKGRAVGEEFAMKGFVSTSTRPLPYFVRQADALYEIKIPAGSRNVLRGFNVSEQEVLLPHNARYRVVGTRMETVDLAGAKKKLPVYMLEYIGV